MSEVWPFVPDERMVYKYEFLTDLMRAASAEKRIPIKQNAQVTISVQHVLTDEQFAYMKGIANRVSSSQEIYIPLWTEAVLIGSVSSSQDEFTFTTAGFDFTTHCIVWASPENFELLEISAINSGSIETVTGTVSSYGNAFLIPVRESYAVDGFNISKNGINSHIVAANFLIKEDVEYGASFSSTSYQDIFLIPYRPTRTNNATEVIVDTTNMVDNGSGVFVIDKFLEYTDFRQIVEFNFQDRDKIINVRDFVCYLKGRDQVFWFPTYFNELTLLSNANANARVKKFMPSSDYEDKFVYLELNDGTKFLSKIDSAVDDTGDVILTFLAPLGTTVTPAEVFQFCFMSKVRSDSDIFEFSYSPGLSAIVSFSVIEVPDVS